LTKSGQSAESRLKLFIPVAESLKVQVRASAGVAEWSPGDAPGQLIERADQAMYREKKLARKQNA
jgi:PleD family two-component response regulator